MKSVKSKAGRMGKTMLNKFLSNLRIAMFWRHIQACEPGSQIQSRQGIGGQQTDKSDWGLVMHGYKRFR